MEMVLNDNIKIWQKYNIFEWSAAIDDTSKDSEWINAKIMGYNPTKIWIYNKYYDVIPLHKLVRSRNPEDGYYRFIYIQINMRTTEYYIGKVNRPSWGEIERYKGSGLLFKEKYKKHKDEFVMYFIASCKTAEETEKLEASIVTDELLLDDFCLNLVRGGGGTTEHINKAEKSKRAKEYMLAHPEQYRSMLETAHKMFVSNSYALKSRNESIKKTMSSDYHRELSRERIKNWKETNPERYRKSRENNRQSNKSEKTRQKKSASRRKWIEEHPEEYEAQKIRLVETAQSETARAKRRENIKRWNIEHPVEAKINIEKRSKRSAEICRKKVNMIDLHSNTIIKTFDSQRDAAKWLFDNGYTKSKNAWGSISSVCRKERVKNSVRTKAFGFGWEFAE